MKKILLITGVSIGAIVALCAVFIFVGYNKFMTIDPVEYDPQVEILLGGGGNSIILTSEDGRQALVVDTKMGKAAKAMARKVRATDVTVVNTHDHRDHVGGNSFYGNARVISGAYSREEWAAMASGAKYPDETIPVGAEKTVAIGGETVHIRNMGRAHTTNDVIVYLEKRKLLVTGDIVFLKRHPALFAAGGCNAGAWIAVLDTLYNRYDIRALVPGHGLVADKNALLEMKTYFTSIIETLDDAGKLALLRKRYKDYSSIVGLSGFDKTVAFLRQERQAKSAPGK